VGGEVAHRAALRFASREAFESAISVGDDVALGSGHADVGEAGSLFAGVSEVDGPKDEHLTADERVGMSVAVVEDRRLNVGRQGRAEPVLHP